ncbi:MAG: hypothetical protein UU48_C0011G0025 [Candidatus Uhrbacteria bacterium GW2011_GWF2_41_16]|uniref:Uncharacterized protein n=2 Tax=Candidatus Uhriibacteriota TaxID=1752732 RepID=A0A0G0V9E9_9BACT|nr:MAG: hypothetical protein UU31_C0004G0024 [Candidatus Uhrbacteria bacterium GW2011_GWA2_41_10]KKR87069.1 MAG: hypothetical protein UU35_C0006G0022 [Candidatus Uhrbacteria bacterium GW2011_GWC2_41_11]KKR97633.1 MAG: hypothetical protein UU48_C0011G0025 [Candidatus Uhrbacteria bacterium GW2011_GWF2_41_16]HBP00459.1 hypothetical protein [Candidatus Uhrbacteria bacterium]
MDKKSFFFRIWLFGLALLIVLVVGFFWYQDYIRKQTPRLLSSSLILFVERGLDETGKAKLISEIQTLESSMQTDSEIAQDIGKMLELGNLKYAYGDLAGAKEWYERILSDHPQDAPALENLGQTLLEMGDDVGAEESWRKAVSISAYEVTYIKLADLLDTRFSSRRSEIGPLLEEAIATLGQTPGLLVRLGKWYADQGLYQEAISHYQVAKQLDSNDQTIDLLIQEARKALSSEQNLQKS